MIPTLYIIIPCYNEEKVLPITAPLFLEQLKLMQSKELISSKEQNEFLKASYEAIELLQDVVEKQIELVNDAKVNASTLYLLTATPHASAAILSSLQANIERPNLDFINARIKKIANTNNIP